MQLMCVLVVSAYLLSLLCFCFFCYDTWWH